MEICELKEILKRQRITYEELAKRTNLSISTITKIFGGYAKYPRVDTIRAIEDALGVGKSQTVLEKEKPPELSDGEKALLELFNQAQKTTLTIIPIKFKNAKHRKSRSIDLLSFFFIRPKTRLQALR